RPPPPGQVARYGEIPDDADHRAGQPGKPDQTAVVEDELRDADIGNCAHRADPIERYKTAEECEAAELPVAISDEVVEQEIPCHRHEDGEGLRGGKLEPETSKEVERAQVNHEPGAADQGKDDEAHRHIAADQLVEDEHAELPHRHAVHLALAMLARPEFG